MTFSNVYLFSYTHEGPDTAPFPTVSEVKKLLDL